MRCRASFLARPARPACPFRKPPGRGWSVPSPSRVQSAWTSSSLVVNHAGRAVFTAVHRPVRRTCSSHSASGGDGPAPSSAEVSNTITEELNATSCAKLYRARRMGKSPSKSPRLTRLARSHHGKSGGRMDHASSSRPLNTVRPLGRPSASITEVTITSTPSVPLVVRGGWAAITSIASTASRPVASGASPKASRSLSRWSPATLASKSEVRPRSMDQSAALSIMSNHACSEAGGVGRGRSASVTGPTGALFSSGSEMGDQRAAMDSNHQYVSSICWRWWAKRPRCGFGRMVLKTRFQRRNAPCPPLR